MYNINVIAQFKLLSTLSLIGPVVLTAIVNISSRSDNRAAVLLSPYFVRLAKIAPSI